MNQEPIKVNADIVQIMNLSRSERRRIARLHGLKNIPSIENVKVTKVEKTNDGITNNENT